eukprot:SAG22_NODE_97_length_20760_cov_43.302850_15_plen_460_part_00
MGRASWEWAGPGRWAAAAAAAALLLGLLPPGAGHGALVSPRSRNAIDVANGVNCVGYECSAKATSTIKPGQYGGCVNATHPGQPCYNGQAAFFYSQGCFIGCPECDHWSGRRQTDLCRLGKEPTLPDHARSVNRNATANSMYDIYRHNPVRPRFLVQHTGRYYCRLTRRPVRPQWRSPGNAPLADVCGLAGGTPWGTAAPEAGIYTNTSSVHHGMNGSSLPKMPTGTTWFIGGEAPVSWQLLQNHGGGYSYRLCPASAPLSEACFQSHPLDFLPGKAALLLADGSKIPYTPLHINTGTSPAGSTWARVPIAPTWLGPRCIAGPHDNASTPHGCNKNDTKNHYAGPCEPCPETPGSDCSRCGQSNQPQFSPVANWTETSKLNGVTKGEPIEKGGFALGILDVLAVPGDLPAGDYVLGWRWDCEATRYGAHNHTPMYLPICRLTYASSCLFVNWLLVRLPP